MTCPTCSAQVLALFHCNDQTHRCWQCKVVHDARLAAPAAPHFSGHPPLPKNRGRAQVLARMEAEIDQKIAALKSRHPGWRTDPAVAARIASYTDCIQVCRDYQCLDQAGEPLRGGRAS